MNDVFSVADRIAVLFLGRLAGVFRVQDVDTRMVVQLMTSGCLPDANQMHARTAGGLVRAATSVASPG
jgi:ABC-type sugar transport system ATPase subunit